MSVDIGTLIAHVGLDTKPLASGARSANSILDSLGLGMGSVRSAAIGLAASVAAGLSVKEIIRFGSATQEQLRGVSAEMRATRLEAAMLTEAVVNMKVPEKGAQSLERLATRGRDAADALAMLPTAMDFGKAQRLDPWQTIDTLTESLDAFTRENSDASRVADQLTVAISRARGTVGEFSMSMSEAGPTAHTLGYDLKETAAYIAVLNQKGFEGAKAGSQLALAMKKAGSAAREWNLANSDLESVLEWSLRTGKSDQEVMDAFGSRAGVAAVALRNSLPDIRKYRDEMRSAAGETKRLADAARQGAASALGELKGTAQSIGLEVFIRHEDELRRVLVDSNNALKEQREEIAAFYKLLLMIPRLNSIAGWADPLRQGKKALNLAVSDSKMIESVAWFFRDAAKASTEFSSAAEKARASMDPDKWKADKLATGMPEESWLDRQLVAIAGGSVGGMETIRKQQYEQWKKDIESVYQELKKLKGESTKTTWLPKFEPSDRERALLKSLGDSGNSVKQAKKIWQEYYDSVSSDLYKLEHKLNIEPPRNLPSLLELSQGGPPSLTSLFGSYDRLKVDQWLKDLKDQEPKWAPDDDKQNSDAIRQRIRDLTNTQVSAYREMADMGTLSAKQLEDAWEHYVDARERQIEQEREDNVSLKGMTQEEAGNIARAKIDAIPEERINFMNRRLAEGHIAAYRQILASSATTKEQMLVTWGLYYQEMENLKKQDTEAFKLSLDEQKKSLAAFTKDMANEQYYTIGPGADIPRVTEELSKLRELLNDPSLYLSQEQKQQMWGWIEGGEGTLIADYRRKLGGLHTNPIKIDTIIDLEDKRLRQEKLESIGSELEKWAASTGQRMTDAMGEFFFDAATGKWDEWHDYVKSIMDDLMRSASKDLSKWLMELGGKLTKSNTFGAGGSATEGAMSISSTGAVSINAMGPVIVSGFGAGMPGSSDLSPFSMIGSGGNEFYNTGRGFGGINESGEFMMASGGIVTRPKLAMIGEAGPEAVIPLSQFRDPAFLDRLSAGTREREAGGSKTIAPTFVIQTPSPAAFRASQTQILSQAVVALSRLMKEN